MFIVSCIPLSSDCLLPFLSTVIFLIIFLSLQMSLMVVATNATFFLVQYSSYFKMLFKNNFIICMLKSYFYSFKVWAIHICLYHFLQILWIPFVKWENHGCSNAPCLAEKSWRNQLILSLWEYNPMHTCLEVNTIELSGVYFWVNMLIVLSTAHYDTVPQ